MAKTLTLKLRFDNETYRIEIPYPNAKQSVCDLGEPLVPGVWSAFTLDTAVQPKWETDGTPESK